MSFNKIDRGLFKFDFTDHYAILGVPLDADASGIRKRYLKVVYQLHPDTCKAKDKASQEKATQILSKLVNPAYEELQKDRTRAEHQLVLKQTAKRIVQEGIKLNPSGEQAKQLAQANPSTVDQTYHQLLQQLAQNQYKDLHIALDKIAEISELNLAYLLGTQGQEIKKKVSRSSKSVEKDTVVQEETVPTPTPKSPTEAYTRRAQAYMEKENYAQAILELREGLKLDPNDSTCHSLLGWAYLKLNKQKMAQIHVKKALQANPQHALALKAKAAIDKREGKKSDKRNVSADDPSKKSGGILGGLFGGNKK